MHIKMEKNNSKQNEGKKKKTEKENWICCSRCDTLCAQKFLVEVNARVVGNIITDLVENDDDDYGDDGLY